MNRINKFNTSWHIQKLCAVSVFCALAYICVFLIRFKVSFLTFDLKDAIMAIGAMYFGPITSVFMTAAVSLLEFWTISDTGVYGLIMNFLSSFSFCLVSSLIYKFRKTFSGAIISLLSAILVMTAVMMLANLFVTPYYMGVTMGEVRKMIPTLLLPFNLIKATVNACVVMVLYKPFSSALRTSGIIKKSDLATSAPTIKNRIVVILVSGCIFVASLLVLFLVMGASVE